MESSAQSIQEQTDSSMGRLELFEALLMSERPRRDRLFTAMLFLPLQGHPYARLS